MQNYSTISQPGYWHWYSQDTEKLVWLQTGMACVKISMEIAQKSKTKYTVRPSNSTTGYLSKGNENTNSKR